MSNVDAQVRAILPANIPQGNGEAFLEKVYQELRKLASANMLRESEPQTLQPTALVHEAWLRLGGDDGDWENTGHFFAAAAQAMRRILIDRARRHSRLKRGGGQSAINLEDIDLAEVTADDRILLINDALEQLTTADPVKANIVELKFFGGLTNSEVARLLNVTERTIERQWSFARTWLYTMIERQFHA